MIIWRISEFASLDGEGGKLFPGRWHSGGQPVTYASDHPASCLCEMLVHVDMNFLPASLQLLKIRVAAVVVSKVERLDSDWINNIESTRRIGDQWLSANSSALLSIPSAIVPESYNYLFNPVHADAEQVQINKIIKFPFDTRLR